MDPRWSLKFVLTLVCFAPFCSQMLEILNQYNKGTTSMAISYSILDSMPLPHFTICPEVGAKKSISYVTESDYMKNTFELEELFHERTLDDIHKGAWSVTESHTQVFGRCFTFQFHNTTTISSFEAMLYVRSNISLIIHVHEEEESFWLTWYVTPLLIKSINFEGSGKEIAMADIRLKRSTKKLLHRTDGFCRHYEDGSSGFTRCAKKHIAAKFLTKLYDCHSPIIKPLVQEFGHNLSLPECDNTTILEEHSNRLMNLFLEYSDYRLQKDCPSSCEKDVYEADAVYFNYLTTPGGGHDGYNLVYVYYKSMYVQHTEEVLTYDFPALLSALGGSMGLFLGFSCLGVLTSAVEVAFLKVLADRRKRENNEMKKEKKEKKGRKVERESSQGLLNLWAVLP